MDWRVATRSPNIPPRIWHNSNLTELTDLLSVYYAQLWVDTYIIPMDFGSMPPRISRQPGAPTFPRRRSERSRANQLSRRWSGLPVSSGSVFGDVGPVSCSEPDMNRHRPSQVDGTGPFRFEGPEQLWQSGAASVVATRSRPAAGQTTSHTAGAARSTPDPDLSSRAV